ncbi:uncharacterized protein [Chelonus insularis]|uniref:uncharacterized protein n=1 Tax=Chelonus insularis TaxID=460826 RepID=UPI00158CBC03|nr:uncharacterized protein LOC118067744 [Chelonus insularis]
MKHPNKHLATVFALILALGYVNGGIVKRDEDDDDENGGLTGMVVGVVDFTRELPLVGGIFGAGIDTVTGIYQGAQDVTDGAVGRILGGAFPCTISLESGLVCSGTTVNSKLSDLVKTLMDPIPGIVMPQFIKNFITFVINLLAEPTLDVIFGGVPLPNMVAA